METEIEQHNIRIVVGPPLTIGGGDSLPTFAYVVAATLRAHKVPLDRFVAILTEAWEA